MASFLANAFVWTLIVLILVFIGVGVHGYHVIYEHQYAGHSTRDDAPEINFNGRSRFDLACSTRTAMRYDRYVRTVRARRCAKYTPKI